MKIQTSRFGEVEIPDQEVYAFGEGLLGFADVKEFVILENPQGGPIRWLQSVRIPALAFLITDPTLFFPDYRVGVRPEDLAAVELEKIGGGVVFVILTWPQDVRMVTANLQGPILLNPAHRKGRQLVLSDTQYSTRHLLFGGQSTEGGAPKEDGPQAAGHSPQEKKEEKKSGPEPGAKA